MFEDFDIVELKKDLVNVHSYGDIVSLPAGSLGTIVMIHDERVGWKGKIAYEVDFCNATGDTIGIVTLGPEDLKLNRAKKTMNKAG